KLLDFNECSFHRNVNRLLNTPALQPGPAHVIWDVEELVNMGHRAHACPYFTARSIAESPTTDIVFMPYNYLLDPVIRGSMSIDVKGAVVILVSASCPGSP